MALSYTCEVALAPHNSKSRTANSFYIGRLTLARMNCDLLILFQRHRAELEACRVPDLIEGRKLMTRKTAFDKERKWRSVTVAFRVSPEESQMINDRVKISGLSKQDYILKRLLCEDVIVAKSPKTYYELKHLLIDIQERLLNIKTSEETPGEYLLDTINHVASVLDDMKDERNSR